MSDKLDKALKTKEALECAQDLMVELRHLRNHIVQLAKWNSKLRAVARAAEPVVEMAFGDELVVPLWEPAVTELDKALKAAKEEGAL